MELLDGLALARFLYPFAPSADPVLKGEKLIQKFINSFLDGFYNINSKIKMV